MSAIAEFKRDGGWGVATGSRASEPRDHLQAERACHVVESCTEQPWAEFCGNLDRPAFLLPITGFAEL